jgi:transposase-like protein
VVRDGDLDSMLVLDIEVFSRRGSDPAAVFLSCLAEHHDLSEGKVLVDSFGYQTTLSRLELSGQGEYSGRNHIGRWFQTLKQRTDCSYTPGMAIRPVSELVAVVRSLLQYATTAPSAQQLCTGRGDSTRQHWNYRHSLNLSKQDFYRIGFHRVVFENCGCYGASSG